MFDFIDDSTISGEELKHLNNCTQCRACETLCPSKMAYGRLFDLAREQSLQAGASVRRVNLPSKDSQPTSTNCLKHRYFAFRV